MRDLVRALSLRPCNTFVKQGKVDPGSGAQAWDPESATRSPDCKDPINPAPNLLAPRCRRDIHFADISLHGLPLLPGICKNNKTERDRERERKGEKDGLKGVVPKHCNAPAGSPQPSAPSAPDITSIDVILIQTITAIRTVTIRTMIMRIFRLIMTTMNLSVLNK